MLYYNERNCIDPVQFGPPCISYNIFCTCLYFLYISPFIRSLARSSFTKLVNTIFLKRMNQFWYQLAKVVHRARARKDWLWWSKGRRSKSHKAGDRFGGLAEASFSTPLCQGGLLVSVCCWLPLANKFLYYYHPHKSIILQQDKVHKLHSYITEKFVWCSIFFFFYFFYHSWWIKMFKVTKSKKMKCKHENCVAVYTQFGSTATFLMTLITIYCHQPKTL